MSSFRVSIIIIYYCFFISLAFAEININFGEFKIEHKDQLNTKIQIVRNYSSRQLTKGFFGYGWCSLFDTKLQILNSQPSLSNCDQRQKEYVIQTTNSNYMAHSMDKLTSFYFDKDLKLYRLRHQNQYFNLFYDNDRRGLPANSLVMLQAKNKNQVLVLLKQNLIDRIHLNNKTVRYQYFQNKLSTVLLSKNIHYEYLYDEFSNMTLWKNTKDFEKINYNNDLDVVTRYLQKDKCINEYEYSHLNKSKFILQHRSCPFSEAKSIKYSFDYNKKQIKITFLKKTLLTGEQHDTQNSQ